MTDQMTPDEEFEFYARPENQQPQGPGRRRLTATVPVRFPAELLEQVRAAAAAEDPGGDGPALPALAHREELAGLVLHLKMPFLELD